MWGKSVGKSTSKIGSYLKEGLLKAKEDSRNLIERDDKMREDRSKVSLYIILPFLGF